jgi:hypothetical protein
MEAANALTRPRPSLANLEQQVAAMINERLGPDVEED